MDNTKKIEIQARKFYGCQGARRSLLLSNPMAASAICSAMNELDADIRKLGGSTKEIRLESGELAIVVLREDGSFVDPTVFPEADIERTIHGYLGG